MVGQFHKSLTRRISFQSPTRSAVNIDHRASLLALRLTPCTCRCETSEVLTSSLAKLAFRELTGETLVGTYPRHPQILLLLTGRSLHKFPCPLPLFLQSGPLCTVRGHKSPDTYPIYTKTLYFYIIILKYIYRDIIRVTMVFI